MPADVPLRPSGTPPFWAPGTQVTWRWGDLDEPHFAEPVTVVRDDADALVVWLAAGTPVLRRVRADGSELRSDPATMFTTPCVQARGTWTAYDVLRVAPTGRAWSVWAFFAEGGGPFAGWYVNIEDPHRRDDRSIRTRDHVLDLWVEPDRSCSRKDEDELLLAVEQGRYDEATAAGIRGVAEEVEALVAAWAPPFSDGWERFGPDPSWPVPALP